MYLRVCPRIRRCVLASEELSMWLRALSVCLKACFGIFQARSGCTRVWPSPEPSCWPSSCRRQRDGLWRRWRGSSRVPGWAPQPARPSTTTPRLCSTSTYVGSTEMAASPSWILPNKLCCGRRTEETRSKSVGVCFLVVAAWSSQGEVSGLGRKPSLVRVMGCLMRFVAGREGGLERACS